MIIFSDVDGTIYNYDEIVPESTVKAIRQMRANGHRVYMVTGRSKAENKPDLTDIGFDGMIGGNGTYIESDGEVVFHRCLSLQQCSRVVDWCHTRGLVFFEESNNGLFTSEGFMEGAREACIKYIEGKGTPAAEAEKLQTKDVIYGLVENQDLYREDVNKISFVLKSYDDYLEAVKEFPDMKVGHWGGKDELALFGDITVEGMDKSAGIKFLLDHLKTDRSQTIAIGDARSDIEMLKYCQVGITFECASRETKEAADYVTEDVDDDGFYNAFRYLGLVE